MQVAETIDRVVVGVPISVPEHIDVIVPYNDKSLIGRISRRVKVLVIKHLDSIYYVYIDVAADLDKAVRAADNTKT